jgi:two-component system LytT family response regulator
MKLRTIIVDDERMARTRLRRLLEKESDFEVVAECADGATALEAVRKHTPDVLLLDVQMPGMDGFEMLDAIEPEHTPVVIFVTAFDQHAVRAFEAHALDYVSKPASAERLHKALDRVRERLKQSSATPQSLLDLLAERRAGASRAARLIVRAGERTIFVSPDEIDWVEAAGNYAILHLGKQSHILRETMSALEAQLPADSFLRVSRSAILNLRRVKERQTVMPGEHVAILLDGQRVTITRTLREIEERLRHAQTSRMLTSLSTTN